MVENVENLVLEQLRHIRSTVDRMETRLDDLTGRVGRLETSFAQAIGNVQVTLAEHSVRMDRIESRLTRIEKGSIWSRRKGSDRLRLPRFHKAQSLVRALLPLREKAKDG